MRALIEIKWVGDSLTKGSNGERFTRFRDARAQEGADQLADYLDREGSTDPATSLKGLLGRVRRSTTQRQEPEHAVNF